MKRFLRLKNKKKDLSSQLLTEVTCLKQLSSLWGGGAFKPRPLELEGVEDYENIHYHVSNIQQYAGKKVTILGGGDSAVDWALAFEKIAPTTLVHRRDNFRALEHSVQALQESSVTIKTPFVPSQLLGDGKTLDKLESQK